jgi:hypothetical protein
MSRGWNQAKRREYQPVCAMALNLGPDHSITGPLGCLSVTVRNDALTRMHRVDALIGGS